MKIRAGFTLPVAACCAALLAPAKAGAAGEVTEHTIRPGDNLHLVAGYYYRDPRQWRRIWKSNRKSIPGPGLLLPGKVLRVETASGQAWEIPYEEFRARARRK